jgi:hypothetical protein
MSFGLLLFYFKVLSTPVGLGLSSQPILVQVQSLGKLEVLRYRIRDVVEHEVIKTWLPNPRALLIISGEMVGCVDLAKMKSEDIQVLAEKVIIRLPRAELCSIKIDHQASKVFRVENSIFESAKLVDEAYRAAENQLKQSALNSGFLAQSEKAAEVFIKSFAQGTLGIPVEFETTIR